MLEIVLTILPVAGSSHWNFSDVFVIIESSWSKISRCCRQRQRFERYHRNIKCVLTFWQNGIVSGQFRGAQIYTSIKWASSVVSSTWYTYYFTATRNLQVLTLQTTTPVLQTTEGHTDFYTRSRRIRKLIHYTRTGLCCSRNTHIRVEDNRSAWSFSCRELLSLCTS